jgi:hypothetical protein
MRNKLVIAAGAATHLVFALSLTALLWIGIGSSSRLIIWLTLSTGNALSRTVEWGCWVLIVPVMLWQVWRISAVVAAWVFQGTFKPNASV